MVQSVAPAGRGFAVRLRVDASVRGDRALSRQDPRREDDPAFPASARGAPAHRGDLPEVRELLEEKRLLVKSGTIVDATILEAPPSTRTRKARDPEMRKDEEGQRVESRNGASWHGQRRDSSLVDDACGPSRHRTDDGADAWARARVVGDREYWSDADRVRTQPGIRYRVQPRTTDRDPPTSHWREINRKPSLIRARCEHPVSCHEAPLGAYGGAPSRAGEEHSQPFVPFALSNPYMLRYCLGAA
jgi:transposase, IS5 family